MDKKKSTGHQLTATQAEIERLLFLGLGPEVLVVHIRERWGNTMDVSKTHGGKKKSGGWWKTKAALETSDARYREA